MYNTYTEYVRLLIEEGQQQENLPTSTTTTTTTETDTGTTDANTGTNIIDTEEVIEDSIVQRGTPEVFEQLTRTFSFLGRQEIIIEALKHTVEVGGFEPTIEFCNELLENALLEADLKTMYVLSNWYIHNFVEYNEMPYGCIVKMLHVACGGCNGALASNCIQVSNGVLSVYVVCMWCVWLVCTNVYIV